MNNQNHSENPNRDGSAGPHRGGHPRFFVYTPPAIFIQINNNQTATHLNQPSNPQTERERMASDMERLLMGHFERMMFDPTGMFQHMFQQFAPTFEQYMQQPMERKGLTKEEMEMLPVLTAQDVSKDHACSICLDQLSAKPHSEHSSPSQEGHQNSSATQSGRLRQMTGCSHVFHEECLFQWLAVSKQCPMCRAEFINPLDIPTSSSITESVDDNKKIIEIYVADQKAKEPILQPVETNVDKNQLEPAEDLECGMQQLGCCWDSQQQQSSDIVGEMKRSESHESISSPFVKMHDCGHVFHKQCLESSHRIYTALHPSSSSSSSAITNSVKCPLCRSEGRYDMI